VLKTALAGLRAHRLRLLLTCLAIMLGVGFIAGTFVLNDTIQAGFSQRVTADADKVDVAVLPKEPGGVLPEDVLERVRAVAGVTEAQGLIRAPAPLLGKDGKAVGNVPTTAVAGASRTPDGCTNVAGTGPGTDDQAAVLDDNTAKRQGFRFEAATDGEDYIEGNAGDDLIFGNLGQDDIIGGSSSLFSLTDPGLRGDGDDVIFGGSGNFIARNDPGMSGGAQSARDADMILGDNGNIYRLVAATGGGPGSVPGRNASRITSDPPASAA